MKSTSGDTFLGGDDFDLRFNGLLIDEFKKKPASIFARTVRHCSASKRHLRAKIELSSVMQTEINLPYLTADATDQSTW